MYAHGVKWLGHLAPQLTQRADTRGAYSQCLRAGHIRSVCVRGIFAVSACGAYSQCLRARSPPCPDHRFRTGCLRHTPGSPLGPNQSEDAKSQVASSTVSTHRHAQRGLEMTPSRRQRGARASTRARCTCKHEGAVHVQARGRGARASTRARCTCKHETCVLLTGPV
jgi:hypothetical protein